MNGYPMMYQMPNMSNMSNMPNTANMANMANMSNMPHKQHMPQSIIVHPVDQCVVECLMSLMGKIVILETTRGRLDGCVIDVKQDHVVLEERHKKFIVRISEIVWIMPE
ncbi:DUF2642 domain-containing protein [Paenibacillus sp. D2_2]|uniref:DUF2642 domain-containing protein n=1 Tax=Paenibacillus sp. D2_2 TaxID=3073092 RepID=UPI0028155614|nr:DUF2642 domain-containing protein [Paenibacillus sp. D2_2]WMT42899.1 DUF2642 domain-containing protein [Paenibacillus sp. D2_2]